MGLYGKNWLIAFDSCQEWVESMIHLVRNKKSFYQRELRAIKLIQQPRRPRSRPMKLTNQLVGELTLSHNASLQDSDSFWYLPS